MLTKTETALLIEFMHDLTGRYSREGSADFEMEDTQKNRELLNRAEAWNNAVTVEQWVAEHPTPTLYGGKIVTNNALISSYLANRLELELEERVQ